MYSHSLYKRSFTLLFVFMLLCCSFMSTAQLQFWNQADIEDELFIPARQQQQVKGASVYAVGESGRRIDTTGADEIREYNSAGKITVLTGYKYNWTARKRELFRIDSFFYNNKNALARYKAFEGPDKRLVYETVATYNAREQLIKLDHFNFYNGTRQSDRQDRFEYDATGNPKKMISVSPALKGMDDTRTFSFDAKRKLIKTVNSNTFGSTTLLITRDASGKISSLKEISGNETIKTILYNYDAAGRMVKKTTTASSGYDDFTEYKYDGDGVLPVRTYLQYQGYGGRNDRRHEYRQWVYVR